MNEDATPLDAVVVGAGISGLVVAHRLERAGFEVALVEAGAQAGGVIASRRQQGCLVESGPNSLLDTHASIGELTSELGLERRYASRASARRYVLRAGVLRALPLSPAAFAATPLFSARAKLALLREPFVARGAATVEESIADFVRRRLGGEFLDYAIDPFVAGIYAGDPERISVQAAFPKLLAVEQRWGSLIRGQVLGALERRRSKAPARDRARSFSFGAGLQSLTDALASRSKRLLLNTRVESLERGADGLFTLRTAGSTLRARTVVIATPATAAAALVAPYAADAAAALREIEYAPVASVASAYRRTDIAHPLDGFGCLVPRKEDRRLLGVLFSSTMFDGRARADEVLLTSFVGGMRQPALALAEESTITELVAAEHRALLGARAGALWHAVTRWPRAIPQYMLGHGGRIERAEAATRALPGLFFCASWKGGVAVGDCIENGHLVADRAAAMIRAKA